MPKIKIYCTAPGCRHWILTTPNHRTAALCGWRTWILDPTNITADSAVCSSKHLPEEGAYGRAGDIVITLRELPADTMVRIVPETPPTARRTANRKSGSVK